VSAAGGGGARGPRRSLAADLVFDAGGQSLLDVVDNTLNKGVMLDGDITISLASVDLIYLRLSVLLCAADRLLPGAEGAEAVKRRRRSHR
jgi:hypothetical protein